MRSDVLAIGIALLLLTESLFASERERRICIPNADASGWICGTEDDPPQPAAPPPRRDAPRAPPRFLADPQGTRTLPPVPIARPTPQQPAQVEVQPVAEPSLTVEALPEPEPEVIVAEPSLSEPGEIAEPGAPEPVAAPTPIPVPEPQPGAEPAPAAEVAIADEPTVDAVQPVDTSTQYAPDPVVERQATPEPVAAPDPQPAPAPVAATVIPAGPWRVDAVMGADINQWTLQLAHGPDVDALVRLAGALGLPADQLFLLPLERDRARWWLLAWGLYETPERARQSVADLPTVEGLRGVWPRRVEPLQNEIERARRTLQ